MHLLLWAPFRNVRLQEWTVRNVVADPTRQRDRVCTTCSSHDEFLRAVRRLRRRPVPHTLLAWCFAHSGFPGGLAGLHTRCRRVPQAPAPIGCNVILQCNLATQYPNRPDLLTLLILRPARASGADATSLVGISCQLFSSHAVDRCAPTSTSLPCPPCPRCSPAALPAADPLDTRSAPLDICRFARCAGTCRKGNHGTMRTLWSSRTKHPQQV